MIESRIFVISWKFEFERIQIEDEMSFSWGSIRLEAIWWLTPRQCSRSHKPGEYEARSEIQSINESWRLNRHRRREFSHQTVDVRINDFRIWSQKKSTKLKLERCWKDISNRGYDGPTKTRVPVLVYDYANGEGGIHHLRTINSPGRLQKMRVINIISKCFWLSGSE